MGDYYLIWKYSWENDWHIDNGTAHCYRQGALDYRNHCRTEYPGVCFEVVKVLDDYGD